MNESVEESEMEREGEGQRMYDLVADLFDRIVYGEEAEALQQPND